jgi:hypothetical protein
MNDSLDPLVPLDDSLTVAAYFPRLFPLAWGNAGQYELTLVKPSEAQETKHDLSIPSNAPAVIVTIQAPFGQTAYTYEVFATYDYLPDAKDSQQARFIAVPGRSWDVPPMAIVIWRRRVLCQGIAAYIEARGDPRTEITPINLINVDDIPAKDVLRALKGRHLLRRIERRGRHPGPAGFRDAQEFEETLVYLIQKAHSKGQDPTEDRIATLLQPVLASRRRDIGSPASVGISIESTKRLIRRHLRGLWHDLVKKALQSP